MILTHILTKETGAMNSKKAHASLRGKRRLAHNAGFTLIELMIAIAIFGIVIAGVIGAFYEQLKSHNTQQQILEMQQNARAAMYYITRELRMAGFDPTGTAGARLTTTEDDGDDTDGVSEFRNIITVSMDINGNGDTADINENITYTLVNNQIIRSDATGPDQILADNIEVLDFVYHGIDPDPPYDTIRLNEDQTADNPDNIRSVNVTIIARAAVVPVVSYKVEDNTQYLNIDGDSILPINMAPDNFRRIILRKTVKLRILGLD